MMMATHEQLASGRWQQLSLLEQLGNVGSEVHRIVRWQHRDAVQANQAFDRALELLDLTMADQRWRTRLRELSRARELLCRGVVDEAASSELPWLDTYFTQYALAARAHR